ncbi:MAG TPA: fibronectin type III domain-containing protein, partial [Cyclobacteriaceae bacterium]|nr:fibronectin type III domain-containing protein [Cyclobacteriaceae bacterium]
MKRIFTLALVLPAFLALSTQSYSQCSLPKPATVKVSSNYSCDATLSWSKVTNAAYYKVRYKVSTDIDFINLPDTITNLSYTFTGLSPNVNYTYSVAPFCSNGLTPGYKQKKKTTTKCSIPLSLAATDIT